jgi:predicted DNA-binding ribbon-helix-helix protein
MKSAITKHSIELNGHKTSVSLEYEFWSSLRAIADLKKTPLSVLLQSIDAKRDGANLSSAIRVFVLTHYRAQTVGQSPPKDRRDLPQPVPTTSFPC